MFLNELDNQMHLQQFVNLMVSIFSGVRTSVVEALKPDARGTMFQLNISMGTYIVSWF